MKKQNLHYSILALRFCLFAFVMLSSVEACFSQAPQAFNYQAIVRNSTGNILSNQLLSFRISLLQGSATGTNVYSEEHMVTTNQFGLASLSVGNGTNPVGIFSAIDWKNYSYFVKVELDINGGNSYTVMGTSPLLSVPYALYAPGNYKAGNGIQISNDTIKNILMDNDNQQLSINNNQLSITNGNSVTLPSNWNTSNTNIYNSNTGNVGIGTSTPAAKLDVLGSVRIKDDSEGAGKVLTSDVNGNATWTSPALASSTGNANYIPKFVTSSSLDNSVLYQNGNKIGLGTISPSGRMQIVADSTAADSEPIFEIKDKHGKSVMLVYNDSVHFFVKDDASKAQTKGAFAVSGKSNIKSFTNHFLYLNADSTRIYTSDTTKGFGVRNIGASSKSSYMQLTPNNYFIGHQAGHTLSSLTNYSGKYNSFIGYQAGFSDTSGYKNYFIGYRSGYSNQNGFSNIFIGDSAGFSNISGYKNVIIGNMSGINNTSGTYNVFLGYQSGFFSTGSTSNIGIGYQTLFSNANGSSNVALGYQALYKNTGNWNVANGYQALLNNTGGTGNVANGYQALFKNISGNNNVANGYQALFNNTTASTSVANGYQALYNNNSEFNVATGYQALFTNVDGNYNTAEGFKAMYSNYDGYQNVAVGDGAMYFNSNGNENVAIGYGALTYNTTGDRNTAVGSGSLYYNTGFYNTAIGYSSFYNFSPTEYSNSTALGAQAAISASNQVRVGSSTVTSIGGQVGWTTLSDGRFKKQLQDNVPGLAFINKLKPVTYFVDAEALDNFLQLPDSMKMEKNYTEKMAVVQSGFIAQDVEKAANELGYSFSGVDKPKNEKDYYGLRYAEFTVPLVKAVQEQQALIEKLKDENEKLKIKIENIYAILESLKK